jgi:hypothetical protein
MPRSIRSRWVPIVACQFAASAGLLLGCATDIRTVQKICAAGLRVESYCPSSVAGTVTTPDKRGFLVITGDQKVMVQPGKAKLWLAPRIPAQGEGELLGIETGGDLVTLQIPPLPDSGKFRATGAPYGQSVDIAGNIGRKVTQDNVQLDEFESCTPSRCATQVTTCDKHGQNCSTSTQYPSWCSGSRSRVVVYRESQVAYDIEFHDPHGDRILGRFSGIDPAKRDPVRAEQFGDCN